MYIYIVRNLDYTGKEQTIQKKKMGETFGLHYNVPIIKAIPSNNLSNLLSA